MTEQDIRQALRLFDPHTDSAQFQIVKYQSFGDCAVLLYKFHSWVPTGAPGVMFLTQEGAGGFQLPGWPAWHEFNMVPPKARECLDEYLLISEVAYALSRT